MSGIAHIQNYYFYMKLLKTKNNSPAHFHG